MGLCEAAITSEPQASFQQPAKELALGTRVREEGNPLSALQKFKTWSGTWKQCGLMNAPQGPCSAPHVGDHRSPGGPKRQSEIRKAGLSPPQLALASHPLP